MQRLVKLIAMGVVIASFAACTTIYRNHGYTPTDDELDLILVGVDTRDSVLSVLGRPASEGATENGGLYYVSSRFRHFAYQEPRPVDRQVVAITFAEDATVKNVERFTLEDGQVVPLTRRVTDSNIEGITFLRQLLGNIGNLDAGTLLNDQPN